MHFKFDGCITIDVPQSVDVMVVLKLVLRWDMQLHELLTRLF